MEVLPWLLHITAQCIYSAFISKTYDNIVDIDNDITTHITNAFNEAQFRFLSKYEKKYLDKFNSFVYFKENESQLFNYLLGDANLNLNFHNFNDDTETSTEEIEFYLDVLKQELRKDSYLNNLLHAKEVKLSIEKIYFQLEDIKQNQHIDLIGEETSFIKKINQAMFLEDKSDKNALKLLDMYISPNYIEHNIEHNIVNDRFLKNALGRLKSFVFTINKSEESSVLIILGQPAVGKSSLISKFLYDSLNNSINMDKIVCLSFKNLNIEKDILISITKRLNCKNGDLEGRVLFLDGFDEASIISNPQIDPSQVCQNFCEIISQSLYGIRNLKVVITSRLNYINIKDLKVNCPDTEIISLCEFDLEQIKNFEIRYRLKHTDKQTTIYNTLIRFSDPKKKKNLISILGMPLILYIICSFQIEIENDLSMQDLYNKIFGEDGYLLKSSYRNYHPFLRKNSDLLFRIPINLFLSNNQFLKLQDCSSLFSSLKSEFNNNKNFDTIEKYFGIACYYKNSLLDGVCEFLHLSIQQYFTAKYICFELLKIYAEEFSNETLLLMIDNLFAKQLISQEILFYLNYYIITDKHEVNGELLSIPELEQKQEKLKRFFSYYIKNNCIDISNRNYKLPILIRIQNSFSNFLNCLNFSFQYDYSNRRKYGDSCPYFLQILTQDNDELIPDICSILHNGTFKNVNLSGLQLPAIYGSMVDLTGVTLIRCNLDGADLRGSNLSYSSFIDCNLRDGYLNDCKCLNADFTGSNFIGTTISGIDFATTNIRTTRFI